MNFYLCLASLCLGIAAAAPQLDPTLDAKWEQWKSQHRRTYGGNEDNWRRATWEKNLRMIEMHNLEYSAGKCSFLMEMNKFGDITNEEFRQVMNGFTQNRFQKKTKGTLFHEPFFEMIPEFVDWRNKGYVTPVKNQLFCGSCWAFSATGSLEGQWFRKTGKLVSLSEQNFVDCSREEGNDGCEGDLMDYAFEYMKKNGGINTEKSYPYKGRMVTVGISQKLPLLMSLDMWTSHLGSEVLSKRLWHHKSGVYYELRCRRRELDHGVLAVGYGVTKKGEKYWIVKNSWGKDWGNNGYILIARDKDNNCGIATLASYPEV